MSLRAPAYALLVLTLLLAVAGEWAPLAVPRGTWRVPAGLLLLGLAWERHESARLALRLAVELPARWRLGRAASVALELHLDAARARAVELAPEVPAGLMPSRELLCPMQPGRDAPARCEFTATARRLGEWTWPQQRLRVAGSFGLAWWNRRVAAGQGFRVIPDALLPQERERGLGREGSREGRWQASAGQPDQLRDYRPGDPLRAIDWKATARRGTLVSREAIQEQHVDVVLAIDVGRSSAIRCGELDRLGHYVNTAARFAELAVQRDDRVALVAFAASPLHVLPPTRGHAGLQRLRQVLGGLEPQAGESNPLPAAGRILTMARHRSLVVLLTDVDDAASAGQLAATVKLLQPRHLPLVAGLVSEALEQAAGRRAQHWLDPYLALAARIGEAQRGRAIRALATLGAPAVVARPGRLEREVLARYGEFRARRRV